MERRKKAKEIPRPLTWTETVTMWTVGIACFAVYHLWMRKAMKRRY